ncbi:hypothetical protein [Paenarthrobacter sp. NPDC057981]|uniref:hypothetical protein n=1 Tax=Paenarthrobacter sp. NPDC057981 TaxID=3346297 RepID=UPI0036DDA6E9
MLVAPKPGATSTFEEYVAARATFMEISRDAWWNPWVYQDRALVERSALAVIEQWQRAEPGFRQRTDRELEEMLDDAGRRGEEEYAVAAARQEQDKKRYDPEREQARLLVLEQESILSRQHEEIADLQTGRYPAMNEDRRTTKIAEIEQAANDRERHIAALASIVGSREDVVDKYGRLPRERREANLLRYRLRREHKVRELRARIPELKADAAKSDDRTERTRLRSEYKPPNRTSKRSSTYFPWPGRTYAPNVHDQHRATAGSHHPTKVPARPGPTGPRG